MTVINENYVFIHVPKAAGRSITKLLGGETPGIPTHLPHFALQPYGYDNRFSFGFVRNPWDRIVSTYNFVCQKKLRPHESEEYQRRARDMGFKRWLMEDEFFIDQDRFWRNAGLPPIQKRSQMFWLDGCDFIGRVESIDQDFAAIKVRAGIKSRLDALLGLFRKVPRRNRSVRGTYERYFDDESHDFVATHFHREIELFDYQF
ncbi:sulfotransferase family protein [Rhizobiaceae bacterium n13]|uniref:Sulfotransferase family protein n=1 Tax=Ferirhizobium litorale TaxID=2927786 RepID=A0AAE3Q889_9HYPH|nr:sulfotransferase family 2 domain-containing protein [Fererhizobium litorale]MDI7860919.1 sulfotransferase family protein [Fererhizobium litorale]MDI7921067.1 sulfotransferase family protein [Fererhizobium litorale]